MIVDGRELTEGERIRLMRTIEGEYDMDAVSELPYPKVRVYRCLEGLVGFNDGLQPHTSTDGEPA